MHAKKQKQLVITYIKVTIPISEHLTTLGAITYYYYGYYY